MSTRMDGRSSCVREFAAPGSARGRTGRQLIEPGRPYEFHIDMWDTSNLFKAGHRIRLEVSSSNFPRYDRNLNTGGRIGYETEWRVAEQAVYHDEVRPSRLNLPVVPPLSA